jgi:hypothetical protein
MLTKYMDIVFLHCDDGREVADKLFCVDGVVAHGITAESAREAVEYLSQWDYGDDDGELRDELPAGSNDAIIYADGGEYVLTANLGLGYVSLSRIVTDADVTS